MDYVIQKKNYMVIILEIIAVKTAREANETKLGEL